MDIKKKFIFLFIIFVLFLESHEAQTSEYYNVTPKKQFYLKGKTGFYFNDSLTTENQFTKNKGNYIFALSIGKYLKESITFDLEYNYRNQNDLKIYDILQQPTTYKTWYATSHTVIGNLNYYFYPDTQIRPYIRAGIGISNNISGKLSTNNNDNEIISYQPGKNNYAFAWQIGTGLSFDIKKNIRCELEFMHLNRGKVQSDANLIVTLDNSITPHKAANNIIKDNQITISIVFDF